MRSKLDTYSLNEEHSRELISKFCRLNLWKYRKMEWDNDIDGEIEVLDKSKQTTAKFIKIQLKLCTNIEIFFVVSFYYVQKFRYSIRFSKI